MGVNRHVITPEDRAKSHASRRAKKANVNESVGVEQAKKDSGRVLSPMEMVMSCRDSLYNELMMNPSASGAQAFVALTKMLKDEGIGAKGEFEGMYSYESKDGMAVLTRKQLFEIPGSFRDLGVALCARIEHYYCGKKQLFAWDEESQMALIELLKEDLEFHRKSKRWMSVSDEKSD